MKVGILYAIEDLKIQDVATPNSSEGEILIKAEPFACALNGQELSKIGQGNCSLLQWKSSGGISLRREKE